MLVIAHEGASGAEQGNSYEAFKLAWEMGADAVEADLRKCWFCGAIALSHDPIDSSEKHENALALKDFLAAEFANWTDLHLEIKEKRIVDEILSLTAPVDFKDHIIYSSFKWFELFKLRIKNKRARIGVLWNQNKTRLPKSLVVLIGRMLEAESIHLNFESLDEKTVMYFRRRGFLVYAYTVNSDMEINLARRLDLDGIFTDWPDLALNMLSVGLQ